jgi:hypothetical protein
VVADTGDPRDVWRRLQHSQLVPSAVDVLPAGRVAVLFEGASAAVAEQAAACPGAQADGSVWAEAAEIQLAAGGRVPFAWEGERSLGRPGPGIAFVDLPPERSWSPLAVRVRDAFDPEGVLV